MSIIDLQKISAKIDKIVELLGVELLGVELLIVELLALSFKL